MRRFTLQAAVTGLLLVPASAFAQDVDAPSGFYVGLGGGVGFIGDQDIDTDVTVNGVGIESDTKVEYDEGFRFGGYVGYQLDTNVRVQLDLSYINADANNILDVGGNDVEADQETEILSGTVGIFFDLWPVGTFVPFVGGGLGIAQVKTDFDADDGLGDSKQTVLTAFAEVGLPFNLTPSLAIVPSARFAWYDTDEKSDDVAVNVLGQAVTFEASTITENLYEGQLLLSARYNF